MARICETGILSQERNYSEGVMDGGNQWKLMNWHMPDAESEIEQLG